MEYEILPIDKINELSGFVLRLTFVLEGVD